MTSSISVGLFSPSTISNCVLWFDAADANTFTLSGSAISLWRDKSSNAYSVGQANASFQPVFTSSAQNGLSGIQLATATYLFNAGSSMTNFTTGSATSVFMTVRNASTNTGWNITNTLWFTGAVNGTNRYHFSLNQGATAGTTLFANGALVGQVTSNAVAASSNAIVGFTASATSATIHTNGSLDSYAGVSLPNANDSTYFMFGDARNSSGVASNVMIFEMVGYNRQVTTFERQQVEGYFAWKWGMVANLPITHPYKNAPYLILTEPVPRPVPNNTFLIPVNTFSTIKTFTLPVASTNMGRMIVLKDYLGYSSTNVIRLSTSLGDSFEQSGLSSMTLSNSYGAWWFNNDGINKWYLTSAYLNSLYITQPTPSFLNGLWVKSYANTGSIPNSNGPVAFTGSTSNWGALLNTTFVGGIFASSNTPGASSYMYYGNNYGIYPSGNTNYSLIASGLIYSAVGGTIQFRIVTDDGFRLDFNGTNAINQWQQQGATTYTSASLSLPAGYTPIIMRWYDTGGGGAATMEYNINSAGYTSNGTNVYFYAASNITQV